MGFKKEKGITLFTKILLGVNFLFILCLVASYLAPFISPGKFWLLAFFGLSYPVWLAFNLFFIILWIVLWKKYFWITLVAVLLGYDHILSIYPVSFSDREKVPSGSIRVLSYNVHNLYGITNKTNQHGIRSKIVDFLSDQKADILCIQELRAKFSDTAKILDRFAKEVGSYYYTYKDYHELKDKKKINALAIFSRFPITGNGYLKMNNRSVFGIYADLEVNGIKVRVYNLHLESIRFGNEDYSFYSNLTEDQEGDSGNFGQSSLKIVAKLKKAYIRRSQQVDILQAEIKQSPYPVMICGDFNDPPTSYSYHILSHHLTDAYRKAGKGLFGNTYAGNFPSFRIDYILMDKSFEPYGYRRFRNDLSDHYPISVNIKLPSSQ